MPRKKGSKNRIVKAESCANPFVIAGNLIEHNSRIYQLEAALGKLSTQVLDLIARADKSKEVFNQNMERVQSNTKNFEERVQSLEKSVFELPEDVAVVNGPAAETN
jgi:hypothetical protein